ncbi:unnamed protein product [Protopolystoma xenopodis]|uniref:Uncharacterized protein n=1 Tax=Protopolystoma xenopodis TaxID=117903 RepID=A0A3S5FFP9_9PLAT|nr:unnamed protein product [Protopolystoma xenopodis]
MYIFNDRSPYLLLFFTQETLKRALDLIPILRSTVINSHEFDVPTLEEDSLDPAVCRLRWFLLPSEAVAHIRGEKPMVDSSPTLKTSLCSPWQPGNIERCFCPDLANSEHLRSPGSSPYLNGTASRKHIILATRGGLGAGAKNLSPNERLNGALDWQDSSAAHEASMRNQCSASLEERPLPLLNTLKDNNLWQLPQKELFKPFLQ